MKAILLIPSFWLLVSLSGPAAAQTAKRLWVLHGPGEMVEYDAASFARKNGIRIPPQAFREPDHLSVNGHGQMLYVPGSTVEPDAFIPNSTANRIWIWDGRAAAFLDPGSTRTASRDGGNRSVVEVDPACFLSSDGQHLFWLENETRTLLEGDSGRELSVTTVYRVRQSDFSGAGRRQIVEGSFAACNCGTGVCSETCPEAELWAPHGGIAAFFLLTHWIPGQLGATYQASFLYRATDGSWTGSRLKQPLEQILDAAQDGKILVSAIPDAACCGWDNESNDQTLVFRNGGSIVVFDERERYANPDYDISFYTARALLSPDATSVAMTLSTSALPEGEIRLSSDGKADAKELARIRQAISGLPAVEVCRLDNPSLAVAAIPHAFLAGWLNEREILILQGGMLVAVDIASGTRRDTQIKAAQISHVFLR
jgi:hypothetical protein